MTDVAAPQALDEPAVDPALALEAMLDANHPVKLEAATWARDALATDDQYDRDLNSVFFREGWQACADRGVQAMTVPDADGGRGDEPEGDHRDEQRRGDADLLALGGASLPARLLPALGSRALGAVLGTSQTSSWLGRSVACRVVPCPGLWVPSAVSSRA